MKSGIFFVFLLLFFQLTDKLFQGSTSEDGMDLVALNLQRGRDHGLAPYLKWRDLCGLPPINGWRDLTNIVSSPEVQNLSIHSIALCALTIQIQLNGLTAMLLIEA